MADDELVVQRWVYAGRRWVSTKGKLYHAFLNEEGPHTSGDERWYGGAPKHASVGSIYAVEASDRQAKVRSAELVGRCRDEQLVGSWRAMDRSAGTAQEGVRAAKRLQSRNGEIGSLTLEQLRDVMESQPKHVQDGTLVVVLRYLTRGV